MPNSGETYVIGALRNRGIRRIREAINTVDPGRRYLKQKKTKQKKYTYLWHIDSHHKLRRWRFVIHGGIDGYSRYIVYLQCSKNNKSETVTKPFFRGS
ncbi:unnamed protein product [Pocillopora meandrina]|uniref:Integrase core domain-containing protein n=1 Tax=Pocillopora meandrina TaxID=46732 RepID=A0AAU9VVC8_9CNID|nr:unnamed protein product [Pocillopora meandrina]